MIKITNRRNAPCTFTPNEKGGHIMYCHDMSTLLCLYLVVSLHSIIYVMFFWFSVFCCSSSVVYCFLTNNQRRASSFSGVLVFFVVFCSRYTLKASLFPALSPCFSDVKLQLLNVIPTLSIIRTHIHHRSCLYGILFVCDSKNHRQNTDLYGLYQF